MIIIRGLCQNGLVTSVSFSHAVSRGFASRPDHTKDHHKNRTVCLPACQGCLRRHEFACDCSRLHQTRFQSCRVRGTIASCETNLRQSGGMGANRGKKSRRVKGVSHDTIFSPDSTTQNLCLIPFKSDQQHF